MIQTVVYLSFLDQYIEADLLNISISAIGIDVTEFDLVSVGIFLFTIFVIFNCGLVFFLYCFII